ncbi:MAG TPA: hypothetical protein VFA45_22260 [Actinomycetes bacterium]|jgi:DNA-directed RNA polymerase specialized sigma24 family protein|nr:hypothetical protein [Actinomycetes bacterium]
MSAPPAPGLDDPQPEPPEPCPCGHGDIAAEIERRRPLVARAIQGDHEAFLALYDEHVDDVYRYVLAWTWDSALARHLTEQVFRGAVTWLPAIAEGRDDLGSWLIALARDAVGQHLGAGWAEGGQLQGRNPPQGAFAAVEQLDDAQREVVVLRLLLGHSVAHTAHLAGYDAGVVQELQLAACATIWQLLSGAPLDPAPRGQEQLRPRWFEHYLASGAVDAEADPGLSDPLAVADALRHGAPEQVPLPDDSFVAMLRSQLLSSVADEPREVVWGRPGRFGRALVAAREQIARHPWVTTTVAAVAIGLVIGLQMAGGAPARSTCAGQSCAATSAAEASDPGGTLPSLPVVGGPDGESSTTAAPAGVTSTTSRPSTTASSAPPTTAPPTTASPTTRTTRSSTTTRRPTTTTQETTTTTQETTTTTTKTPGPP